jgi:rhomboid protease GluP
MTWTDPREPHFGQPEIPHQPFSIYLAKQFIAKKGFEPASVPEVEKLAAVSDIVLTQSDGYTFTILCMIDRETHPDAVFELDVEEVRRIGEACLQYTGEINRAKMPVFIRVLEIGPGSNDQQQRLKPFKRSSLKAKVIPSAMIVDTASGEVWNSDKTWVSKGVYHGFVEQLVAAPREADANLTRPVIAVAQPSFPILTAAILAVLFAVFAAEIVYGIGPWTKMLEPTIATLVAFGGLAQTLVLQSGEWYRLSSAPFLHVDATHLAMNAVGLFLAGRALESLIGRAWFGALYAVGALGGSLLSLVLNPASIVSVGASGAIMGLFAAMLVISMHFPPGALRTGLQMNAIYVLIPSLLPLASALQGHQVDYAAHFGGAIGGVAVGFVMLRVWSQTEISPGFRQAAAAIAVAGVVALAYPVISILQNYQAAAFTAQLIPPDKFPKTNSDMRAHAAELIAQYPHDPRPRFLRTADLLDANDPAGAEREARVGLAEEEAWRSILTPQVGTGLRAMLAIAISRDRPEEARSTARPACAALKDGPMRKLLDDRKLCGT